MQSLGGVSMQVNFKNNIKDVTKGLSSIQKNQIPFAAHQALNDTAFFLKKGYAFKADQVFEGKATPFTKKGFQVAKSKSKRDLTASVFIADNREAYMKLQIDGGTRVPKNTAIVIPNKNNFKGAKTKAGNIGKAAYNKIKKNKTKYFFGVPKGKQGSEGIWERYGREATGTTGGAKIRQVAKLTKQGKYKSLFPFETYGERVAFGTSGFDKFFSKRMAAALRTAK